MKLNNWLKNCFNLLFFLTFGALNFELSEDEFVYVHMTAKLKYTIKFIVEWSNGHLNYLNLIFLITITNNFENILEYINLCYEIIYLKLE